jgi:transposase
MATTATTRVDQEMAFTPTLFVAFELGVNKWKLGCTTGAAQRPRERQVPAGDCQTVLAEIRRAKSRFGFPEAAHVMRCYAAGRDGFWLHRFFVSQGIENIGVDSASLAVHRRYRRAKTDRLDVPKLLTMLRRHAAGEKQVGSVVRVPSVADADRRQLHRELLTTKRDRTRVINRIKGLLAGFGMRLALHGEVETPLPAAWRARLKRAWQKVQHLTEQSGSLEAERRTALRTSEERVIEQVRQ